MENLQADDLPSMRRFYTTKGPRARDDVAQKLHAMGHDYARVRPLAGLAFGRILCSDPDKHRQKSLLKVRNRRSSGSLRSSLSAAA